jgi:hypothetical protein
MQERPELLISSKDDVTATSTIATIRTTFSGKACSKKVNRACPTVSGAAHDFHIIDEVGFCHS